MKANRTHLVFSDRDFQLLSDLVEKVHTDVSLLLEEELARATVVPIKNFPADVVAMTSVVRFKDLDSGQETEVQIVYPEQADAAEGKISILAPIGAALIGLRIGQSIEWPVPGGRQRKIEVLSVFPRADDQAS